MQKERFEYIHSVRGCEWAIIAPIVAGVFIALIGIIYGAIAHVDTEALQDNAVYLCVGTVLTELSFLVTAFFISRHGKVNFIQATGIKVTTPWWTYLGAIALSILVLLLLNPIIGCWQILLDNIGYSISTLPFEIDSVPNLFLGLLLFALIPAICEEFLFRGLILNGLRKYGMWTSVLTSAAFFGIMHMSLLQLPYTFLLGVVLGFVVYFTRNLTLSILMHFINNATVLIIGFITAGTEAKFVWYDILIGVAGLALFVVMLYFVCKFMKAKFFGKTYETEHPFYEAMPELDRTAHGRIWWAPILIAVACLLISILGGFGVI